MNRAFLVFLGILAGAGTVLSFIPYRANAAPFPDGSLLRQVNDERVYLIENGQKRWIESAETFRIQGFLGTAIRQVSAQDIASYPSGEPITSLSLIIMPGEDAVLPDLVPFPLDEFRFDTLFGRTILRFRSVTWNQGRGPLHLFSNPSPSAPGSDFAQDVMQHIRQADGTVRNKEVGNFVWHAAHNHFHFTDVAEYRFTRLDGSGNAISIQEKTTRCMWDTAPYGLHLNGAPQQRTFLFDECKGLLRQGIAVGWGDIYENTLADQYLDVSNAAPGLYQLSFVVDPDVHFVERRKDNNQSIVLLDLDVAQRTLRVVGSAGPFLDTPVSFADGTLIRGEQDPRVYVMHRNRKRWLKTQAAFSSYGYSWNSVRILPQSIIDAIPMHNLVRAQMDFRVFALNDAGYKRHILNPVVFGSYGFTGADIAQISQTEFQGYPDARSIRRAGDSAVFRIDGATKRLVSGSTAEEVHTVNSVDFGAYITLP